jgi:hypothetical protein
MHQRYALLLGLGLAACGGGGGGDLLYGETTFVIVVNPEINDVNVPVVPEPGLEYLDIEVCVTELCDVTSASGTAVLVAIDAGTRDVDFFGGGIDATVALDIGDRELREVAIAAEGDFAEPMSEVVFAFRQNVVEVHPDMTIGEVNDALAQSGTTVFFAGGTYTGDLVFGGSEVTLFGDGPLGDRVFIDGNVTIPGSGNRIRGATISGDLLVSGSDVSVSYTHVDGATDVPGSDAVLLMNRLCGPVTIGGGGTTALGNAGLAPVPSDC